MATPGRAASELVFLHRGPLAVRAAGVVVAAIACGVGAVALTRLHDHLAAQGAHGEALNALQTLVAHGSSLRTLWPGWVAGLCFAIALLRLRRGTFEASASRVPVEERSAAQLRRGLRIEYLVVRVALVILTLVAALDVARAALTLAPGNAAHDSSGVLLATCVEAAGYIAATIVLAAWAWSFGSELRRLGAL